jgi:hypothetical protein
VPADDKAKPEVFLLHLDSRKPRAHPDRREGVKCLGDGGWGC